MALATEEKTGVGFELKWLDSEAVERSIHSLFSLGASALEIHIQRGDNGILPIISTGLVGKSLIMPHLKHRI